MEDSARVVTADNIGKVNNVLDAQAAKLIKLRELVNKELGMHAVAGVSPFGWQLVSLMEKNPELDKEILGWDMEEVRLQYFCFVCKALFMDLSKNPGRTDSAESGPMQFF